jgi:CHASE2 domain-containing sensor protein
MNRSARRYIAEDPARALNAAATLWGRFWNVVPLETGNETRSPRVRIAIGVLYTALSVLVVIGLIRLLRADWRAWLPIVALIAGFTAVHALYWADMRMRTPLVPALGLLAARALGGWQTRPSKPTDS